MTRRDSYYLDDFTDEVLPIGLERTTLEGWAEWLAGGGDRPEDTGHVDNGGAWTFDPPADGTEYAASVLKFDEDVSVERPTDPEADLIFSRAVSGYDFAAANDGAPGWTADEILDPGSIESDMRERLEPGESTTIVVARNTNVRLRYRTFEPRLEIIGTVQ